MATLAAGSNTSTFLGYGQTVTLTTTHNVSGRWYFISQNTELVGPGGMGHQFGPTAYSDVIGPFAYPGTLYIENFSGSAAAVTYTVNSSTAYPGNFTTVAASTSISGPVSATTLAASGAVTLNGANAAISLAPTGTGSVTINPATAGNINNMAIGQTTAAAVKTSNLQATYTDSSGTPGNVTNNSPRGRAAFAAAGSSVVVTNSLVTATSSVFVQQETADATLTTILSVVPAAGSFTVTGNAAATGTTKFSFFVVN